MQHESPKLLDDIRTAAAYILDKTRGKSLVDYASDDILRPAVERHFEIIGEASKKLSEDIKQLRGDIPWRDIAGLRDVLIHDYMGVDVKEVWNVVANHLPALEKAIDDLLGSI